MPHVQTVLIPWMFGSLRSYLQKYTTKLLYYNVLHIIYRQTMPLLQPCSAGAKMRCRRQVYGSSVCSSCKSFDGAPAVCSHSCNSQAETEAKLLMSWQHPHVLRSLTVEICRLQLVLMCAAGLIWIVEVCKHCKCTHNIHTWHTTEICLRISLLLDNNFALRQSVVICLCPAKVAMSTFTKDQKAGADSSHFISMFVKWLATSGLVHSYFIPHVRIEGDANRKLWLGSILSVSATNFKGAQSETSIFQDFV